MVNFNFNNEKPENKLDLKKIMLVIGVAGGTGSGKTTVVRKIQQQFPKGEVNVLSHDSYYRDNKDLSQIGRAHV